jgi:hypothetical protein
MARTPEKLDQILTILLVGGGIVVGIGGASTLARLWHDSAARWTPVPCVIQEFEVKTDPEAPWLFRVKAAYDYQFEGRAYHGTRVWPHGQATKDYEDISRFQAALTDKMPDPPSDLRDLTAECLVDPEDPSRAVLEADREPVAWGFAYAGLVILGTGAFIFFSRRQRSGANAGGKREPLPLAIYLFLATGGVAASAFSAWGVRERWCMSRWTEVPATVVATYVQQGGGVSGRSSRTRQCVLYRYQFDGREYLSNRTTVLPIYDRNRRGAPRRKHVVRRHPPGTRIVVFVDPGEPWRAVMDRKLGWSGAFLFFPLPFLAFGGWGIAKRCWPSQRRKRC